MSGSEPRHAAHESVEERLAEEVVEGLDLHPVQEPEEEPLPSMSEQIAEQLGGVRGLIESSLPVFAFVILNVVLGDAVVGLEKRTALYWAIAGAVVSALAIGGYRLIRKEPVRHAVNGLFGIAIGAFLAYRTGKAENFYLPGILLTFGQAAVLLLSVVVRKPLIGYAWGIMANKGQQNWFDNSRLFRTFQWLTLVWVVSLCIRAGIQYYLWAQGEANALGIVRILISWPIYAATFAFSAWAIHRVTSRTTQPS
ncbi:DUF3159 domain-containing protein [Paractinoplanes atraurantiacus]|uniref:Intracellular septation protein A n=1 Tax=Paractinoplanes atraurantiacus TaxID=1036182 RepID=A0A285IN90_9ACTN|nr:DUF3159 domain-containing protein [Actinoplanes atraurantiacus]SNY49459.1 Protein of unknown function [Actinoplanes atraurantiacus]